MNDDERAILKYMKRHCSTAIMNFNPYHEGALLLGLDPDDDYPSLKKIGTNLLDDINFVINLKSATKKLDSVGENIQDVIKDFQKLLKKISEYKDEDNSSVKQREFLLPIIKDIVFLEKKVDDLLHNKPEYSGGYSV